MTGSPPLEFFIDPEAKPTACHKPSQVPIHFKKRVEAELRRDVRLGVLEEIPPPPGVAECASHIKFGVKKMQ